MGRCFAGLTAIYCGHSKLVALKGHSLGRIQQANRLEKFLCRLPVKLEVSSN